jgi:predicted dithiol-disulfide oxidoreductase (DUF899 family)
MGWTFGWASSLDSDFNFDFNTSVTEDQQRSGTIDDNYRPTDTTWLRDAGQEGRAAEHAAMTGTDRATYAREQPGMSAFVLQDGASTTPTQPMRAAWTAYGACISGWTRHRTAATTPGRGSAGETSTPRRRRGPPRLTSIDWRFGRS